MKPFRYVLLTAFTLTLFSCKHDPDAVIPEGPTPSQQPGKPTDVGEPIGEPVTKNIGPAGGDLTTADNQLTLTFPKGALSKDVPVTIREVKNTAPNSTGTSYRVDELPITVSEPVIMIYRPREHEFSGLVPGNVGIAQQNSRGIWGLAQVAQVDAGKRQLTGKIRRVSQRAIAFVENYKLTPETDTVVYGEVLTLKIVQIGWNASGIPDPDDDLIPMPGPLLASMPLIKQTRINGDQYGPIGDGTFGKIDGRTENPEGKALLKYTAPAQASRTNPVALSVELTYGGKEQLTLISNIYVINPVELTVDGITITPLLASATNTGNQTLIQLTQPLGSDPTAPWTNLGLTLTGTPKVGRYSFAGGAAGAVLGTPKGGKMRSCTSYYTDKKNNTIFTDGEVNLLNVDRAKGVIEGNVRGTVVYVDRDQLYNVKVAGHFRCQLSE